MVPRPPISPSLACKDVDKTYDYFTRVLGFAGMGKWAGPDGRTMHAAVVLPTRNGDAPLMLGPLAAGLEQPGDFARNLRDSPDTLGNGVAQYIVVPDVDKYHAFVAARGGDIVKPLTDEFWGDRTFIARTPDGYHLWFAAPIKGFKPPPGMGAADGADAVQATAPGTRKNLKIPSSKKRRAARKR